MAHLFVSHANHDKVLVEAVVDLLEVGVGVPHREIFCSSLKGQNIKPGEDFVDSIGQSLGKATCVLALISEAYYASAFCMCELGGVWLQSKSLLPVLIPPVDHSNLKAVLGGLQVSKIGSEEDLDELRDELVKRLGIEGYSTPRWNTKRKVFLEALPGNLKKIRFKGPVTRAMYEKLDSEFRAYRSEYEEREKEIEIQKRIISDLKKIKEAKAVSKVVQKHSSSIDTFKTLTRLAANALGALPHPVREALYYRVRNEEYLLKSDDAWESVQSPLEYGQLSLNSDETAVVPNLRNTKVRKAAEALDELARWLDSPPEDFYEWYGKETDGEEPDMSIRSFWDRHLSR